MKSCRRVESVLETRLYEPEAVADVSAANDGRRELEISDIFTDHSGTLAGLRMADHSGESLVHASDLSRCIRRRLYIR